MIAEAEVKGDESKKPRILVVDDENGPRQALRMLLNQDYRVLLASDVKCAMEIVESDPIDLIITDISMPRQTGVDLLREVKSQNPDLQVILFTGYGQLATATKAVEYGAFAYMEKPFENDEMLRVVKAALDKSSSEQKRRELERVALESNRFETLGRLMSGMMHDMGTPLSVLNMQIEIAREKTDDDKLPQRLATMSEQVDYCLEVVRSTMDYLRSEPEDNKPWRLNPVIVQSMEIAATLCRDNKVDIRQTLGEHLRPINGDMMMMRQAVLNLITNAVQAMAEQTGSRAIEIATWQDDTNLYLTVDDSGPGIAPEDRDKIFRTFYTTKANSGTGLGLSVVKTILEKMNASIAVETAPQGGARFLVTIPAHKS